MIVKLVVLESAEKKKLENAGSEGVLKKLGGQNAGLPFFAFIDAKGELVVNSKDEKGANIGHPFAPHEIAWFITMLKKAAPDVTERETSAIEGWLKSQKK